MTKTIDLNKSPKAKIGTQCLICGEFIELTEYEIHEGVVKICDKCKKAVMQMRDIPVVKEEPFINDKGFYLSERYENMAREQEFIDNGRIGEQ